MGRSVYVIGDHEDLGSWDPTKAVRLYWTAGNNWTGQVAVQAGQSIEYKYIARFDASGQYCVGTNVNWIAGPNLTRETPVFPDPPYAGKTLYYHSGWTNVGLVYRVGTNWHGATMTAIGPGRSEGEILYRVSGIGVTGEPFEFVPFGYQDGTQHWDNAPYPGYGNYNYYTTLDVAFLQDGHIYNYFPPAAVSAPQILQTNFPSSYTAQNIPSRDGRIYLPRGYEQNTWKRYPVLYMHDGQNVFDPGGPFGSWSADPTATREISQGRMRETIIVAVNNTAQRNNEYGTPHDGYTGDYYLQFLLHDVKPKIDAAFRTQTGMMDTGVMGSSLGGLISAYAGLSTNVFGLIGAVSPSYWYGPNFRAWIEAQPTKGRRIYQDCGTGEGADMWNHFWSVYTYYLQDGYAPNDDLLIAIGCGHGHNEAAWAARLPAAFQYLFSLWDEPNRLAIEMYPPRIETPSMNNGIFQVGFDALRGFEYRLDHTTTLTGTWSEAARAVIEPLPWSPRTLQETNPPGSPGPRFYRIIAQP